MSQPFIDLLLTFDTWANQRLLEACCTLPQEKFDQQLPMGQGSLTREISHLVSAHFFFADRLNRAVPHRRYDTKLPNRPAADFVPLLEQGSRELQQAISRALSEHGLTEAINWTNTDTEEVAPLDRITYGVALAQIINHSIHHRTQAALMLRQLGYEGTTDWHPFDWDEVLRKI